MDAQKICRLCLHSISEKNFTSLDEDQQDMLELIIPNFLLNLTRDPVICNICIGSLQQSYDFKIKSIETEDKINFNRNEEDTSKLSLESIFDSKINDQNINEKLCRTCLEFVDNNHSLSINNEYTIKMFNKCIPELDLGMTKEPTICYDCFRYLENHFYFVEKCIDIQEKIHELCEKQNCYENVNLQLMQQHFCCKIEIDESDLSSSLLNSGINMTIKPDFNFNVAEMKPFFKYEMSVKSLELTKLEIRKPDMKSKDLKRKRDYIEKLEESNKFENEFSSIHNLQKVDERLPPVMKENIDTCPDKINNGSKFPCAICDEGFNRTSSLKRHIILKHCLPKVTWHYCNICEFKATHLDELKQHNLTHSLPEEETWQHKLKHSLPEVTVHKLKTTNTLQQHKRIRHVDKTETNNGSKEYFVETEVSGLFQCSKCSYRSIKSILKKHFDMVHDEINATTHKCQKCSFSSTYRSRWLEHQKQAHDFKYRCNLCDFTAKSQHILRAHSRGHKSKTSENRKRKRPENQKDGFEKSLEKNTVHQIEEKTVNKLPQKNNSSGKTKTRATYNCNVCPYRTSDSSHFKKHLNTLTHIVKSGDQKYSEKDHPKSAVIHNCNVCHYRTRNDHHFKRHLKTLTHIEKSGDPKFREKDHPKLAVHNCNVCHYKTSNSSYFKRHLNTLTHIKKSGNPKYREKDHLKLAIHKCNVCPYRTRNASHFKRHLTTLTHIAKSRDTKYREKNVLKLSTTKNTKPKTLPKQNSLTKPKNSIIYKCKDCIYTTNQIVFYKSHLTTHRTTRGVSYDCKECGYRTLYENNFKRHLATLTHASRRASIAAKFEKNPEHQENRNLIKDTNTGSVKVPVGDLPVLRCKLCSFQTKSKGSLKHHKYNKHRRSKGERDNSLKSQKAPQDVSYECKECGYKTLYQSNFKRHLATLSHALRRSSVEAEFQNNPGHQKNRNFVKIKDTNTESVKVPVRDLPVLHCKFCSFETKSRSSLISHESSKHGTSEGERDNSLKSQRPPNNKIVYHCMACEYKTESLYHFKRHEKSLRHAMKSSGNEK